MIEYPPTTGAQDGQNPQTQEARTHPHRQARRPGAEPPKEGEAAPAEEGQQGIYVSSRHRNPLEAAAAAGPVKKEHWAWAAILAIITLAIFATLVYIEWADMYMLRYA